MSGLALPADSRAVGPTRQSTRNVERNVEAVEQTRRVLIADDRSRSRRGLQALLMTHPGIEVVGEAGNGQEALRLVEERRPDTVVIDAKMPAMDGLTATRMIKNRWPEVRVIMLTMYSTHRADALGAGADAFLVKGCLAQELLDAILGYEESER